MSLEIAEYERTLESLQSKLDERVQQLQDAQDEIGRQEKRVEDYKMQVGKDEIDCWGVISASFKGCDIDDHPPSFDQPSLHIILFPSW